MKRVIEWMGRRARSPRFWMFLAAVGAAYASGDWSAVTDLLGSLAGA